MSGQRETPRPIGAIGNADGAGLAWCGLGSCGPGIGRTPLGTYGTGNAKQENQFQANGFTTVAILAQELAQLKPPHPPASGFSDRGYSPALLLRMLFISNFYGDS